MRKRFQEVSDAISLDAGQVSEHMSKLIEEVGEFAQGVNKMIGRKKKKISETDLIIKENIAEEAADTIQCIFGVCSKLGIDYEMINSAFKIKNQTYHEKIIEKNGLTN